MKPSYDRDEGEEVDDLGRPMAFEAIDKLYDNLYDYLDGGDGL